MLHVFGGMIITGERFWKEVKIRVHVAELRYTYLREFHG
jgi:hypothetical protein